MLKNKIIALTGPTCSGKSSLGIWLAKKLSTEIISVDSMAVYKGMDIGTAKPSIEEMDGITHHLIDITTPDIQFSAADFRKYAEDVVTNLLERGKIPVLVGGTGLYLRALLYGLFDGPPSDPTLRKSLIEESLNNSDNPNQYLYSKLRDVDMDTAVKLHPNDQIRIIRALEVFYLTDKPISLFQKEHNFMESKYDCLKLSCTLPRNDLYERINKRVLTMMEHGFEDEVASLLKVYSADVNPMKSIGYLHISNMIIGLWSREFAIEKMQCDTRQFSKRQIVWFKKEKDLQWIPPEKDVLWNIVSNFLKIA